MTKKINILLIEDNANDSRLVDIYLREAFLGNYSLTVAEFLAKGIEWAEGHAFDAVICDISLPDSHGMETFDKVYAAYPDIPVIILTGMGDETFGINSVSKGAADFLNKNFLDSNLLRRSIIYSIERNYLQTQLRQNAAMISESEKKFRTLFEESKDPIYLITPEGMFVDFNRATIDLFGYTTQEMYQLNLNNLYFTIEDRQKLSDALGKSGSIKDFEVVLHKKDGAPIICLVTSSLRNDEKGNPRYQGIIRDITEIRKVEELNKEKKVAQELMLAKSQFFANMSHEIRTPMNAIIGLTQVLLNDQNLNIEQRNYLDAIKASGDMLLVIINDVLDISKMDSGKMVFEEYPVPIRDIVSSVENIFRPKAEEKEVILESLVDEKIPKLVLGDSVRLKQILMNLVSNAVKFTDRGKISIAAKQVKIDDQYCTLEFSVADTGMGIPEDKLSEVFESFMQGASDVTRKYGGTGLGLSISKKLVELQGGTIWVRSEVDKGTTFSFSLRFPICTDKTMTGIIAEEDFPVDCLKDLKVLIVEDNSINQLLAMKVLSDWGCKAQVAEDGQKAISKLQDSNFDLVLMDIKMPEMNGYEATRFIRENTDEPLKNIPIMAVTAHAAIVEKKKCMDAGMNDYISKPFNLDDLFRKMARLANKSGNGSHTYNNGDSFGSNLMGNVDSVFVAEEGAPKKYVNLNYLNVVARGNNEFMITMINSFIQQLPENIQILKKCLEERDWEALSFVAHKIRPLITFIGIKELEDVIDRIEINTQERKNFDALPGLIKNMSSISHHVIEELKEEVEKLHAQS